MDYLLAAHINVTGGEAAAAQFSQMAIQVNNFGAAAAKANTGNLATGMAEATKHATAFDRAMTTAGFAVVRMATYGSLFAGWSFLKDGVEAVLDFNQAMTESLAIQTGVTDQMRGRMEDMAKSVAISFGEAPKEVAEGFYFMASAGLNAEQQIASLPLTMQFARAGMMDLEQATEQLFDALSAVGQKSDDPEILSRNLKNMADVLTTAAVRSQATVEQMGYAITTKAGAAIKGFNLDLNESVGVLEVFANQGIKGRTAGERFSMLIRDMAIKSQKFGDEWAAMGVQVFDSSGQFNSLITIFEQLDAALLPLSGEERIQALLKLGFTMRDVNTVMGILGTSGTLKGFVEELDRAGGTAQRVAEQQMESLRAKLNQLSAAFQVGAITGFEKLMEFGDWLGSEFGPALDAIAPAAAAMGRGMGAVFQGLGAAIGGAAAGTLSGIADAIGLIGSFASQHQGAVQAFGFAIASLAGAKVIEGIVGLGASLGGALATKIADLSVGFRVVAAEIGAVIKSGGSMGQVLSAGIKGVMDLINPVTIAFAAVAATAGLFWMQHQRETQEAKANMEQLGNAISSSLGISAGEAGTAIVALNREIGNGVQTYTAAADAARQQLTVFTSQKLAARDLSDTYKDLGVNGTQVADALSSGTNIFGEWSEGFKNGRTTMNAMREQADQLPASVRGVASALLDALSSGRITETQFIKITDVFDDVADSTDDLSENFQKVAREALTAAYANGDINDAWLATSGIMDISSASAEQLADAMSRLRAQTENPAAHNRMGEAAREGQKAMQDTAAAAEDAAQAVERFQQALEDFSKPATMMGTIADLNSEYNNLVGSLQEYVAATGPLDTAFTTQTDAALDVQKAMAGLTESHIQFAGKLAEEGQFDAARAHLTEWRGQIEGLMRSLGASEPQIAAVIQQLGLTDAAIQGLKGEEAVVQVSQTGAEETKAAIDAAAPPTKTTVAELFADPAAVAGTEIVLNDATSSRTTAAILFADPAAVGETEIILNEAARKRDSEAAQFPSGQGFVNAEFDSSARLRHSPAQQIPQGHGTVDATFNQSARTRDSWVNQWANTFGAENALNYAARTRESRINVVVSTTSITGVAGIEPVADGGIFRSYAGGGFENHVAQIGPAGRGVSRLWNEPETGGEAYIPLAMSKRARSLAIWEQTGKMLGVGGPTSQTMNVSVPINVAINGATDPAATGRAVAAQVEAGISKAMQRMLVEMRSY